MEGMQKLQLVAVCLILVTFGISQANLAEDGRVAATPDSNEPRGFEFGTGPATLVAVDCIGPLDACAFDVIWPLCVRLTLSHGTAPAVWNSPEFQVRVFLDSPACDWVLYHCGEQTLLVTPTFEIITDHVWSEIDDVYDEIYVYLPFLLPDMSGLAVLAWDCDPRYRHQTVLRSLDYYGFEIGRASSQRKQEKRQQMNETYVAISSDEQIREADNKAWPAGPGDTVADDWTKPPGNPGPLYKGWPLTFAENTRFWEYSGSSGFVKRVHIDSDGDGQIDPGEPHGYIGRCPYVVGINTQRTAAGSSTWISRWQDHGQRIVHKFRKFIQPDGSVKWQVESTHETQQPDGTWKKTRVPPPATNPIINDPYQNPNDVPGNSAFGL